MSTVDAPVITGTLSVAEVGASVAPVIEGVDLLDVVFLSSLVVDDSVVCSGSGVGVVSAGACRDVLDSEASGEGAVLVTPAGEVGDSSFAEERVLATEDSSVVGGLPWAETATASSPTPATKERRGDRRENLMA